MVNRYNEVGPTGSVTWTRPEADQQQQTITNKYGTYQVPTAPQGPTTAEDLAGWTRTTSLGESEQRQKDQRDFVAESLGGTAQNLVGQIPSDRFSLEGAPSVDKYQELGALMSPDAYSADADKVEKATYDRMQNLMRPQFEERNRALDNRLAVMGLPASGEAYGIEKDRAGRLQNEADLNASLEAVRAGRGEQSRMFGQELAGRQQLTSEQQSKLGAQRTDRGAAINESLLERSQPFNELAAILQGSPAINAPQAPQTAQYQAAPPDISGMIQNQYATDAANQSSKKGGVTDLLGAGAMAGATAYASDINLKTNIQPVGVQAGHNVYTWDWNDKAEAIGLTGSGEGVIAQEIEEYAPWAVTEKDGYKAVYYQTLFGGVQ